LTAESWIRTSVSDSGPFDNASVIDFGRNEYYTLFIRGDDGRVGFSTAGVRGKTHDFYSQARVNDGKWHHIAVVYNGV